ncbi:MAG: hypothetical protein IJ724_03870 [Muribaculaceae bacterium]|nr:hypothetical protein [Muribaculaceae bacterium]
MRQTIAYCVWAASAAFMLLNGWVLNETTMLVTLIGIIAGFLVLCVPDCLEGLDGMNDTNNYEK